MFGPIAGPNGQPIFPHIQKPQIERREVPEFSTNDEFTPVHDFMLVRRLASFKTELQLPDSIKDREQYAEVISAGPGTYTGNGTLIPPCAKPGDLIFLPSDDGTGKPPGIKVTVKGEELYLIRANNHVLGVFNKPKAAEASAE